MAAAYKRLVGAGLALSQGRRGTIIRAPSEPGEQDGAHPGSPLIDLASGNPDPARLPDPLAIMAGRASPPRLYGEATVDPRLQAYASQWYAGDCPAAFEVDLTHGAIDAIERLLGANLAAGDTVAVEAPGFLGSINALRALGLRAEGVALDAAGMLPDALERALADGAQAVLLTPRAQNPTGASLTRARARALRQVLQRYPHVMVIADDHFAHLSASPYHSPIPAAALRWAWCARFPRRSGPTCGWPSSPAIPTPRGACACGWPAARPGSATCCRTSWRAAWHPRRCKRGWPRRAGPTPNGAPGWPTRCAPKGSPRSGRPTA